MNERFDRHEPPVSPNPFGADAPADDQVGLAVRAMGAAMAASVVWYCILTFLTAGLRPANGPAQVDPSAGYVNLFLYGILGGILFAGLVAFLLMAPVASYFRRGGLAIVATLAGFLLSMGVTFLTNELLGGTALLGIAGLAAVGALLLARSARAAAR